MPAPLTVARARTHLGVHVFDPVDFVTLINEAAAHLVIQGDWLRSNFTQEITAPDGFLVLGRRAEALLGFSPLNCGSPRSAFPLSHEYSEVGPGDADAALPMIDAIELPNVCTFRTIPTPSVLTFVVGGSFDTGENKLIRIYGRDAAGNVIFGADGAMGEEVSLAVQDPVTVDYVTTNVFSMVEAVELPVTKGYVLLKAGILVIGRYEPGETNPSYRCYKVGTPPSDVGFKVLCSRRHVDVIAETDLVFPPHLGALKNALLGIIMENNHDVQTAAQHYALAFGMLNAAGSKLRGAVAPAAPRFRGPPPIPNMM